MLGTSALTKIKSTNGVVHVGMWYVLMLRHGQTPTFTMEVRASCEPEIRVGLKLLYGLMAKEHKHPHTVAASVSTLSQKHPGMPTSRPRQPRCLAARPFRSTSTTRRGAWKVLVPLVSSVSTPAPGNTYAP